MSRQRWVLGAVVAIALANTGCVTCCHKSHQKALENAAECELPAPCRGQVYVFMFHGVTPSCDCGLNDLRMKLAASGFAKIGVAELGGSLCVAGEIKKILKCEPDARFVFVGYDVGGAAAVCVAKELSGKGVPVEALVLLDPVACGEPSGVRTLLITSGPTTSTVAFSDRLVVSETNHFKLPAHPRTVDAITHLLMEVATTYYQEAGDPVPAWTYKHAPEMRVPPAGKVGPDWKFLADTTGTPAAINTPTAAQSVQQAGPVAPSTSAGPVVIKR